MKTWIFLVTLVSITNIAWSAGGAQNPTDPACEPKSSNAYLQSPIDIVNDASCAQYTTFSISLTDDGTTARTFTDDTAASGAYAFTPTDAGSLTFKFTSDSTEEKYTVSRYLLRKPSEHKLHGETADAELQIEMTNTGTGAPATFSILFDSFPTSETHAAAVYNNKFKIISVGSANTVNLNLKKFADNLNSRSANILFLNVYTYEGTEAYDTCDVQRWFVYGTPLLIPEADLANIASTTNSNRQPASSAAAGFPGSGSYVVDRLCVSGFFEVFLGDNYGLWFGVAIILFFFIFTLAMGEQPIKDPDYQENYWTHHPFVSIYSFGNELHTKKSRSSLFLVTLTVVALFNSVFYEQSSDPLRSSNIIVYAVYSTLINLGVTFFVGNLLRGYYRAKHYLYKNKDEIWEQRAQNRLFAFYFTVFVIVVVGWPFCVWRLSEIGPETSIGQDISRRWVASFFVSLGLELLIIDPIACILCRVPSIKNVLKLKGYLYDKMCHETYMRSIKQD